MSSMCSREQVIDSIQWSPASDYYVVAVKPKSGDPAQVYICTTDGLLRRRLTFSLADDTFADWGQP